MVAGLILCVIGLSFLLVPPNRLWTITEKWKTKDGAQPSKSFAVLMRVLGIVFAAVGVWLLLRA